MNSPKKTSRKNDNLEIASELVPDGSLNQTSNRHQQRAKQEKNEQAQNKKRGQTQA